MASYSQKRCTEGTHKGPNKSVDCIFIGSFHCCGFKLQSMTFRIALTPFLFIASFEKGLLCSGTNTTQNLSRLLQCVVCIAEKFTVSWSCFFWTYFHTECARPTWHSEMWLWVCVCFIGLPTLLSHCKYGLLISRRHKKINSSNEWLVFITMKLWLIRTAVVAAVGEICVSTAALESTDGRVGCQSARYRPSTARRHSITSTEAVWVQWPRTQRQTLGSRRRLHLPPEQQLPHMTRMTALCLCT